MKRQVWLTALIGTLAMACGDDVAPADTDGGSSTSTGDEPTTMTMTSPATTMTTTGVDSSTTDDTLDPDSSGTLIDPTDPSSSSTTDDTDSDDTNTGEPATFVVTIENLSGDTPLAGPFSPGVWAEHDIATMPIFDQNTVASAALALLAEDGVPTDLLTDIEAGDSISSGVFNTPVDAEDAGPIGPGESYSFEFLAQPGSRLSFASMLIASNDVFVGTGPLGIALFQANGNPIDRDITNSLALWDAGSEAQQPPGGGGYQPLGIGDVAGVDGPDESGVISVRNESTRAIPASRRLIDVDVALEAGTTNYTITFENISEDTGGLVTTLSGMAWANHDDTVSIVTPGGAASDVAGLESLAEDGDPTALEETLAGLVAKNASGVLDPMAPGESVTLPVTGSAAAPFLSFATMVVASNDAFIAPGAEGIRLVEDDGSARSAGAIEDDILDLVAVWDAGTEANQTPGAGPDQPTMPAVPNTGADDEDATIRLYRDDTNDLADPADVLSISVTSAVPGTYSVTVFNVSGGSNYDAILTPVVWGASDGTIPFFTAGMAASPGLEELAEDGVAAGFDQEIFDAGITNHGITDGPTTSTPPALVTFTVVMTTDDPFLNIASMIVPSNDTFVTLGELGVDFTGGGDEFLDDEDINTALAAALRIYDAGTEQNQAGASGRDMAGEGLQAAGNTGAPEGSGMIRNVTPGVSGVLTNEPVWSYPSPQQLLRVTVAPVK